MATPPLPPHRRDGGPLGGPLVRAGWSADSDGEGEKVAPKPPKRARQTSSGPVSPMGGLRRTSSTGSFIGMRQSSGPPTLFAVKLPDGDRDIDEDQLAMTFRDMVSPSVREANIKRNESFRQLPDARQLDASGIGVSLRIPSPAAVASALTDKDDVMSTCSRSMMGDEWDDEPDIPYQTAMHAASTMVRFQVGLVEVEKEELRRELEEMHEENFQLTAQVKKMTDQYHEMRTYSMFGPGEGDDPRVPVLEKEVERLKEELKQLNDQWGANAHAEHEEMAEKIQALEEAREAAEAAVEEHREKLKGMIPEERVHVLKAELEQLASEKHMLSAEIFHLTDDKQRSEREERHLAESTQAELAIVKEQLQAMTARSDKFKADCDELREAVETMRVEGVERENELAMLSAKNVQLTHNNDVALIDLKTKMANENSALEAARVRLADELSDAQSKLKRLALKADQLAALELLKADSDRNTMHLENSLEQLASQKKQALEELKAVMDQAALAATHNEESHSRLRRDLLQKEGELTEARDRIEALQEAEREAMAGAADTRIRVAELTEVNEAAKANLAAAEAGAKDAREQFAKEASQMRQQMEKLREQLKERTQDITSALDRSRASKDTEEELRAQVRHLKGENEMLQSEADRNVEMFDRVKARLEESLGKQSAELQQKLTFIQKIKEELADAKAACAEKAIEIEMLTRLNKKREEAPQHQQRLLAIKAELERSEEARKREAREKDELRAANRVQLEDLRLKLKQEKQRHADALHVHLAASQKWRATAEEERRKSDTRVQELHREYTARAAEVQEALTTCRESLADEQARALALQRRAEDLDKGRVAFERQLEERMQEEVREQLAEGRMGSAGNTVPANEHRIAVARHEELVADFEAAKHVHVQLKRQHECTLQTHKEEMKRLRQEMDDRLKVLQRDAAREKEQMQQVGWRDGNELRTQAQRAASLEDQLRETRTEYMKREDDLSKQVVMLREKLAQQERAAAREKESLVRDRAAAEKTAQVLRTELHSAAVSTSETQQDQTHSTALLETRVEALTTDLTAVRKEEDALRAAHAELKLCLEAAREEAARVKRVSEDNAGAMQQQVRLSKQREERLDMIVSQMTTQIKDVQRECDRRSEKLQEMREKYSNMRVDHADKTQKLRAAEDALARAQDDLGASEAQLTGAQVRLEDAEALVKTATAQRVRDAQEHEQKMAELEGKVKDLKLQQEKAQRDDEPGAALHKDYTDMLHVVKTKERALEKLHTQVEEAEVAHAEELRALRQEMSSWQSAAETKQFKVQELQDSLLAAETELTALRSETEAAKAYEQHLLSEVSDLHASRASVDKRLHSTARAAAEADASLQTAADAHAQRVRQLQHKHESEIFEAMRKLAAQDDRIADLMQTNEGLKERLDRQAADQRSTNARTTNMGEALRHDISLLRSELEMKGIELANEASKAESAQAELVSLKRSAELSRQTNVRLRGDLQAAEAARETLEAAAASEKASAKEMRDECLRERTETQARQERDAQRMAQTEERLSDAAATERQLRVEVQALQEKLERAERAAMRHSAEMRQGGMTSEELADEARLLKSRQRELLQATQAAQRERDDAVRELATLREDHAVLQTSMQDLDDRHARLRASVVSSSAEAERQMVENRLLEDALQAASSREAQLRRQPLLAASPFVYSSPRASHSSQRHR